MLNCPNEHAALNHIVVENVPVDQCPTCGGYWLQRGELETLADHHGAHLQPITVGKVSVVDSKRNCPEDGSMLCQHEFAEHTGITIDQCPTCQGIWLESAELGNILGYLEAGGVYKEPTLSQRAMLFLYQLVQHPPLY